MWLLLSLLLLLLLCTGSFDAQEARRERGQRRSLTRNRRSDGRRCRYQGQIRAAVGTSLRSELACTEIGDTAMDRTNAH